MNILTQAKPLENWKDNQYLVHDAELDKAYLEAGFSRSERRYKIKERHKEYNIICPEYRNDAKGLEPVVIIPEFLVPGRPYLIYVYMYAIDLYSSSPEKGQRQAAEKTRRHFVLETFAHTTLGRALRAFVHSVVAVADAPEEGGDETASGVAAREKGFPNVQATAPLRQRAEHFLRGRLARAERQQLVSSCCRLAREWYRAYQRYLL